MPHRVARIATLLAAYVIGAATIPAAADEAPPPRKPPAPGKSQSPKDSGPVTPKRCQTTSECPGDQVCKPVGDHKECQAAPRARPVPT
jgi:hypothetical protein